MKFNETKFELIQFKPKKINEILKTFDFLPFTTSFQTYSLTGNIIVEPTSCVKDLGVFIDSNLDWNEHIRNICKRARRKSGWILNTFHTRNEKPLMTLYKTLVRPILDYNSEVWNPYKLKHITEIEKIVVPLSTFKTQLDKYLKEIPDNPPLPGYPKINNNNNSIIKTLH